jgi:hypothetical protein
MGPLLPYTEYAISGLYLGYIVLPLGITSYYSFGRFQLHSAPLDNGTCIYNTDNYSETCRIFYFSPSFMLKSEIRLQF